MVYKVVSTKLTEEEHTNLLDYCSTKGLTPSFVLRDSLSKLLQDEKPTEKVEKGIDSISDLRKALGISPK